MTDRAPRAEVRAGDPRWRRHAGPLARLGLLGSLYFAQGLPYGFFTQAVPVLLRQQGASLSKIGFTALLTLPWALKFLWAPLVDRWSVPGVGRRRSWILPMQVASTLTLLWLALWPGATQLTPLMIGMGLLNLFAATQDIATDGLAVDALPPGERGLANGLQVAGYRLGMVVAGGLLLAYYEQLGDRGVFGAMAGLTALASVPVWRTRETTPAPAPRERKARGPHFLRRPGVWRVVTLLLVYKTGASLATGMLRPFLADAGMKLPEIGWLLGTVGFIAGLFGALVGGALVNPLGQRRALLVFGALQALSVGGYVYLAVGAPSALGQYAVCAAEHFASGLATASLFTAMMGWCRPDHAATDYTVQASAVVIATGAAAVVSGALAQELGYALTFATATVLCALAVGAAALLFPKGGLRDAPPPTRAIEAP
ncbi:MAG: MFS transporter [Kofleriaceae bacterium]